MAENSLVFNMIANSSNFTAGMKQAQKAADSLFMATRTGAEKFAIELENLQKIAHLTKMDPDTFQRAYGRLKDTYDPFGVNAQQTAADAEKRIAMDKAEYIARVSENAKRMQFSHAQQIQQASVRQDTAEIQSTKSRTAAIIAAERTAAQARINHLKTVAAFRERVAEQSGRALIREAQQEARAASIMQMGGGAGGNRAMIVQQLAFAAEDAATQFGTRGLAGAMMAAGNNLTFAASMINPLTGVLASVGMTAAMVAATFFKVGNSAKGAAEETDKLSKSNDLLFESMQKTRELSGMSSGQLASNSLDISGQIEDHKRLLDVEKARLQQAELTLRFEQTKIRDNQAALNDLAMNPARMGGMGGAGMMLAARANLMEATPEIEAAQKRIADIKTEMQRQKAEIAKAETLLKKSQIAEARAGEIDARNQQAEDWLNASEKIADEEDKLALRQEMIEARKKKIVEEKRTNNGNLLAGAMDIFSAPAFGVIANSQARAALGGGASSGSATFVPQANATDKKIEANSDRTVQTLERMLNELVRRPSIPVMELN